MTVERRTIRPIAIIGPTGSGKSALALELAEHLCGEIVNCDAMQQYIGMDIGTAKTPMNERRCIPHHQIDVLHVTETATVARYQQAATTDIENLLEAQITPIIVGGSMLYIQSLLDEWKFPPTDPQIRESWEQRLIEEGAERLHEELRKQDSEAARTILPTDSRRIVRALEVIELTGKPFAASQPRRRDIPKWNTRIIGLYAPAEWLNPILLKRTESMFNSGLVEETELLCEHGLKEGVTASRAIGYQQAIAVLENKITTAEAIESTFISTRQYVRRQRSWFKRDDRIDWIQASLPLLGDIVLTRLWEDDPLEVDASYGRNNTKKD